MGLARPVTCLDCSSCAPALPLSCNPPPPTHTQGTGDDAALLNAVIIGGVNLVSTFVSIYLVDRAGRRILFLEGGAQVGAGSSGAALGRDVRACCCAFFQAESGGGA